MGFTGNIALEAAALGKALLAGAALGIYYDLFRILRRVFHFGYAMILAQDLFFWITGAVGIFFCSAVVYGGQLRIIFVCAALVGWGIYSATVGAVLMKVFDFVSGIIRRMLICFARKTIKPLLGKLRPAANRISAAVNRRKNNFLARLSKKGEKTEKSEKKPLELSKS
ncbi:MAG: hypothetical protein E7554_09085 [Ruminococcaceae bacterium]|nr:hypothetical protein [Oscillospiraceae bacterium]